MAQNWLSQGVPTAPASAPRFWHSVAHMVGNSNFKNPGVPVRMDPVGMPVPQHWQPPITTNSTADAALKGLPQ